MPLTKYAIEHFISARVTQITQCGLADLNAEFPHATNWVSGFALMVIFVNQPREEMRPFALQFVRRVEMVLSEYASARSQVEKLVVGNTSLSHYYRALHHIEVAIGLLYQAHHFAHKILGHRLFEPNDGSPLQRLNLIYGASRHQVATTEDPVWFTNDAIETPVARLTFREFESLARTCAELAQHLTRTQVANTKPDA